MPRHDTVSRRNVLKTSALATSALPVVGSFAVGSTAATTQEEARPKETFLGAFAGGSPLVVFTGGQGPLENGDTSGTWTGILGSIIDEAVVSDPEGVLVFVPRRLADEDEQVGIEDMLVMASMQAFDSPDGTTISRSIPASVMAGDQWFPQAGIESLQETFGSTNPFLSPIAEEGLETNRVLAFPVADYPAPDNFFPEGYEGPEPSEFTVEEGMSLEELAAEGLPFIAAAGHNFFASGLEDVPRFLAWEELADAEGATVLEL